MLPRDTDDTIDITPLRSKTVGIVGYGNQGRPHALNLKDSGIVVKVGLRPSSGKQAQVLADGLEALSIEALCQRCDVIMLMTPDEAMGTLYREQIAPYLSTSTYLGFCHGMAICTGWVTPRPDINVFLLAPKAQGRGVRARYLQGQGVPGLVAVHQDPSGDTLHIALAYGKALGCGRAAILHTTFAEEMETNHFGEQAVLCGGLTHLAQTAFEVLIEAGYSPEVAYFECLHEIKLLADLLYDYSITGMRQHISKTALFGDITRGPRIIDGHVKASMQTILQEVRSGQFAQDFANEVRNGFPQIQNAMEATYHHPIEVTGRTLHQSGVFLAP